MAKRRISVQGAKALTEKSRARRRAFILAAMMAALLALACPWTVPVGLVPISAATFFLFLLGLTLPRGISLSAVAIYLSLGAIGLPVFSAFTGGFGVLLGPTGGFLWGYLPAVFLVSLGQRRSRLSAWLFLAAGQLLLYLFGILQFLLVSGAGLAEALAAALLPFLLPDLVKLVGAYSLSLVLRERLKRHIPTPEQKGSL